MNCWTNCWDSLEREKARLLTADRFRSSRTRFMSSVSFVASSGETTGAGWRPSGFLPWVIVSCWSV